MNTVDVLIILITLLFSAFFSGMEIAYVQANKLKIELDKKQGSLPARLIAFFGDKQAKFISTLLVGNNIALVMYGIKMAAVLDPKIREFVTFGPAVIIIQTLLSTLLVLVTAEFLPKTIFKINPNKTLNLFAVPVTIIYFLLYPIVWVTIGLSSLLLNLFLGENLREDKPIFGRIDLDNYLKEATDNVDLNDELENEVQIFRNALDFSKIKVRECMVPRTDIIALNIDSELEDLKQKFIETGLSKILIYRESIDNIIGYIHAFELFKSPESVKNILLPIAIVPEAMPASELMEFFIQKKKGIALVVDEFGGTSGMITIEDTVEEIFGEIEDEHDSEDLVEIKVSDFVYRLSARLEVDYLNDVYKLNLPESEDYETLAGLIIDSLESIPTEGQLLTLVQHDIEVLKVSDNKIDEVIVTIKESVD